MAVPPPASLPAPHADKAALRAELRRARLAFVARLDAPALAARLAALHARLMPLLARDGAIAGYLAHRGEPDMLDFLRHAHAGGRTIALPHIGSAAAGAMRFIGWRPGAALDSGPLGIGQPDPARPEIAPAILLVPLVGFDRQGHRLGQGGGYYDRWFAAHPDALRVGIAWSIQEVPAVPRDPWDMPLDAIATEAEWIAP